MPPSSPRRRLPWAPLPGLPRPGGAGLAGLLLAGAMAGSPAVASPSGGSLATVVAADGVLCDLSRTLAQGLIRVTCLLRPSQDPHLAALRPSDRQALAHADLVLVNGYGLSPALARVTG